MLWKLGNSLGCVCTRNADASTVTDAVTVHSSQTHTHTRARVRVVHGVLLTALRLTLSAWMDGTEDARVQCMYHGAHDAVDDVRGDDRRIDSEPQRTTTTASRKDNGSPSSFLPSFLPLQIQIRCLWLGKERKEEPSTPTQLPKKEGRMEGRKDGWMEKGRRRKKERKAAIDRSINVSRCDIVYYACGIVPPPYVSPASCAFAGFGTVHMPFTQRKKKARKHKDHKDKDKDEALRASQRGSLTLSFFAVSLSLSLSLSLCLRCVTLRRCVAAASLNCNCSIIQTTTTTQRRRQRHNDDDAATLQRCKTNERTSERTNERRRRKCF